MMKYEDLVNKRYRELEDGNFDDDEDMEPVVAIAAHLI